MLVRSLRVSPAILFFLALCAFLGWQFRQGPSLAAHQLSDLSLTKSDSSSSKKPRIAVVTFITDEKSYVHTSLKNKDRKSPTPYRCWMF